MEIEAKFAIQGSISVDRINGLDLSPFTLRPLGEALQRDLLLDTAERAISGSRHALRIRRVGASMVLTFKGPAIVAGGVHQREELEAGIPDAAPEHWPAEIRERVRALAGEQPLLPLLELEVTRSTWAVERDGKQVGELALDRGLILAGGKTEAINELELELKGGEREELEQLSGLLSARLPLEPEARSKMQRGLALLDR